MTRTHVLVTGLCILCAFQGGLLAAGWLMPDARADDPFYGGDTAVELEPYPGKLLCKAFAVELPGPANALPGGDTPAGRWVQENDDAWQIYGVTLEVAQKSTGFPQPWLHVCLSPR
jgi:hypothetical protein